MRNTELFTFDLCSLQGFCTYWSVTVLTALCKSTWPVCWNLNLGSVCHRWYCTLEILLVSVSAAFQRFVQVPETSEFNACLMTGCGYCACGVWRGGRLLWLCFYSFVVLSIGALVCKKTWTARQHFSIHYYVKYCSVNCNARFLFVIQDINIVLITEGINCNQFDTQQPTMSSLKHTLTKHALNPKWSRKTSIILAYISARCVPSEPPVSCANLCQNPPPPTYSLKYCQHFKCK